MAGRFWVKRLEELPLVPTDDSADFDWYPLQHHFGIGAFGINAFGGDAGIALVAEHDERAGGHEEVYVIVRGVARFTLDGESFNAPAVSSSQCPMWRLRARPSPSRTERSYSRSARRPTPASFRPGTSAISPRCRGPNGHD